MKIIALVLVSITALLLFPLTVLADSDLAEDPAGTDIAITVVVPRPEINRPMPEPQPVLHHVYPVHVWESRENGRREIIRVYKLRENESPAHIPREPFERDGFRFELAEIVRREMPTYSTREHVEVIEVNTQTDDLATIIRLLSQTMEHLSEDGYFGTLSLDISSIEIESQGTTSSSHTARRTREFPHLSSADTSLIPRTVTENGRTYNLASVDWRPQSTTAIDYRQIATAFTAVATYTRTATSVQTIGYTTTAKYRGQVSRVSSGRTEFTAHFIGIPIAMGSVQVSQPPVIEEDIAVPEPVPTVTPDLIPDLTLDTAQPPSPSVIDNVTVEQVHIGGIVIETEQAPPPAPPEEEEEQESEDSGRSWLGNVAIVLLFVASIVLAYFVGKKGKAMLGLLKRASCVVIAAVMVFGIPQTAVAAELPSFGFGRRDAVNAVHFNTGTPTTQGAAVTASHSNGVAVHFDPRRVDIAPGTVRMTHSTSSIAPRADPAIQSPSVGGVAYGDNIGVLTVERLGRTVNVIAGATMAAMDFGAGWFSFTGLNSGNTALIGHNRGRSNGFFDFVRHLREGDILTLEAGGVTRRYAVTMLHIIDYTDFSPLMQFGDNRLTLITCVEYQHSQRRIAAAVEIFH